MTKSIEKMWKEGFIKEPELAAPKVNSIYERKSQNLVDKMLHMFNLNIKAIIIGSFVMLALMTAIGAPFLGIYICCLLVPLVVIAKKELAKSYNLSKGQSSYEYITNFNCWLQDSIAKYSQYYKVFYPMLFIGMATQAVLSDAGGQIILLLTEKFPTEHMVFNLPYYLLLLLVILTLVIARSSEALYRFDLNLVYGNQFNKLKELIADMEELRN